MGTLTGDMPNVGGNCPHKLPTSCRLTATRLCCACQDKRPHQLNYAQYIDGTGMCMTGTRWQRYCWFCKEFWHNRVAATRPAVLPSATQIPDVPDQTDFLDAWHGFHRGSRVRKREDGTEETVLMVPEVEWRDVAPGHLPLSNTVSRAMVTQTVEEEGVTEAAPYTSIEDTLDELIEAAEGEQEARARYLRAGQNTDADVGQRGINQADRRRENATRNAERTASNLARAFGTREEMQQQGSDYVSPLSSMFSRAYDRYRVAEEVRAAERQAGPNRQHQTMENSYSNTSPAMPASQTAASARQEALDSESDVRTEIISLLRSEGVSNLTDGDSDQEAATVLRGILESGSSPHENDDQFGERAQFRRLLSSITGVLQMRSILPEPDVELTEPVVTLDSDDRRPAAKTDEEMTIQLSCKICLQQIADIACLPCGHLSMCLFCADAYMPARPGDHTQPARRVSCPVCRKKVKKRVRIFTS